MNVLMAHQALRWFCSDRRNQVESFEDMQNVYLQDIATSVTLRHERNQQEQSNRKTSVERKETIRNGYGFLVEAMLLGIIAESEEFRRARIVALPASPYHEYGSKSVLLPRDVMLWKVEDDHTATPIGGIQAKSKRRGTTTDPLGFTATFLAISKYDTRLNHEIVTDWVNGKNLEYTHERLRRAIARSGNQTLINALGLVPSE
jgi:hypothetical protein